MKLFSDNRMCEKILCVILILMLGGMMIQNGIFNELGNDYGAENWYVRTLVYNVIGVVFIIALRKLFSKVKFEKINSYIVFALYCAGILIARIIMQNDFITFQLMLHYYTFFYPIIFSMCVYANEKKENKGIITSCLICAFSLLYFGCMGCEKYEIYSMLMVSVLVMGLAIKANIFGKSENKILSVVLGVILVLAFLACCGKSVLQPYPIQTYLAEVIKNSAVIGRAKFENAYIGTELYSNYVINSVFSYCGILVGIILMILLAILLFMLFKASGKIKGKKLIANAVSIQISIQVMLAMVGNFGIIYCKEFSVPYVGYGLINTVVYSMLIGVILGMEYGKKEIEI